MEWFAAAGVVVVLAGMIWWEMQLPENPHDRP